MRFRMFYLGFICLVTMSGTAMAGLPIYDDFEDGNATDGQPLSWGVGQAPYDKGQREVINGDYVLTPDLNILSPSFADYREADSNVEGVLLQDVSIETTARALGKANDYGIGLYGRETWDGIQGVTIWSALKRDGTLIVGSAKNDSITNRSDVRSELDAFAGDVRLRLDIIGDTATALAWPADAPTAEPVRASIKLGAAYMVQGRLGVWNGQFGGDASHTMVPIAFRDFRAVPEPTTWSLMASALIMGCGHCRRQDGLRRRFGATCD